MRHHILMEFRSQTILAVHKDPFVLTLVEECTPDTIAVYDIHHPNYLKSFFLAQLQSSDLPKWRWDKETRTFLENKPSLITDQIRRMSEIAVARAHAFSMVTIKISLSRYFCGIGVYMQDYVYLVKRSQAEAFKNSGYDEKRMLEFPFVL